MSAPDSFNYWINNNEFGQVLLIIITVLFYGLIIYGIISFL